MSQEPLIAVIDDDESFRLALVESLGSLGYDVRDFSSAEAFLASGDLDPIGCVITDIHMPGMSGIDLARRLMARQPRIPMIMVTARSQPGLDDIAAANGAVCVLHKPFESQALTGCLQRVLNSPPP